MIEDARQGHPSSPIEDGPLVGLHEAVLERALRRDRAGRRTDEELRTRRSSRLVAIGTAQAQCFPAASTAKVCSTWRGDGRQQMDGVAEVGVKEVVRRAKRSGSWSEAWDRRHAAETALPGLRTPLGASVRPVLGPAARLLAVDTGADTKLGAEGAVEVRHVAEAAIESDVEDSRRLHRQPHRRFTQARPENVLVRRHTRQTLENTEEVIRAQTRLSRQACKGVAGIGMALDPPHGSGHARHSTRWGTARVG
jgi:hypothetical protein